MLSKIVPAFALLATASLVAFQETAPKPAVPDSWKASDLIQPAELAARLKDGKKPTVLYVGFPRLYRSTRIPGALLAGPGGNAEGLATFKEIVSKMPKDADIVLYCGCCPWKQCPNVRPTFALIKEMGYTNVKLVEIPMNLHTDWVLKDFPVDKGAPGAN